MSGRQSNVHGSVTHIASVLRHEAIARKSTSGPTSQQQMCYCKKQIIISKRGRQKNWKERGDNYDFFKRS